MAPEISTRSLASCIGFLLQYGRGSNGPRDTPDRRLPNKARPSFNEAEARMAPEIASSYHIGDAR